MPIDVCSMSKMLSVTVFLVLEAPRRVQIVDIILSACCQATLKLKCLSFFLPSSVSRLETRCLGV